MRITREYKGEEKNLLEILRFIRDCYTYFSLLFIVFFHGSILKLISIKLERKNCVSIIVDR